MDSPSTYTSIQFLLHKILESQKIYHDTLSACITTASTLTATLASLGSINHNHPQVALHALSTPTNHFPWVSQSPFIIQPPPPPHNPYDPNILLIGEEKKEPESKPWSSSVIVPEPFLLPTDLTDAPARNDHSISQLDIAETNISVIANVSNLETEESFPKHVVAAVEEDHEAPFHQNTPLMSQMTIPSLERQPRSIITTAANKISSTPVPNPPPSPWFVDVPEQGAFHSVKAKKRQLVNTAVAVKHPVGSFDLSEVCILVFVPGGIHLRHRRRRQLHLRPPPSMTSPLRSPHTVRFSIFDAISIVIITSSLRCRCRFRGRQGSPSVIHSEKLPVVRHRWWYKRREGSVSQRAIGLKGFASAMTTAFQFAILKVSRVGNVGDSVHAASAPSVVN